MSTRATLFLLAAMTVASGCGSKRVAPAAAPVPSQALIALLPDPESGVTGRAIVTNEYGSVNLAAPRAATEVRSDRAPGAVQTIDQDEVSKLFETALAALPPEPKHFTLYFKFESDELTDESAGKVADILIAVKRLAVPEVVVVGHTDTLGDATTNTALGLKRAMSVRNVLLKAGITAGMIEVTSHGEADPLVKTRDNVSEPRNRRVEISVK